MEPSLYSIQTLVAEIKKEILSHENIFKFVTPSAYDTAWMAMIPDPNRLFHVPMFKCCLDWILDNQKESGFWGESYGDGSPTIDTLPATLACIVALTKWKVGLQNVEKGIAFIHDSAEMLLEENYDKLPRWFVIVFPGMIELAISTGLEFHFKESVERMVSHVFSRRQQIIGRQGCMAENECYPPLLSYMEALPSTFNNLKQQEEIVKLLSADGSLFQSPSATSVAFMATENAKSHDYLKALVRKCPHGVPAIYPMDEELIKLCLVDHIQRLGLAEYFTQEIEQILSTTYRNMRNQGSQPTKYNNAPKKLYKDALVFCLLRTQGYDVKPQSFCWFLGNKDILRYLEENCQHFNHVMFNVFKATNFMFLGEVELENARLFSEKLLKKSMEFKCSFDDLVMFPNLQQLINHELSIPWITRLDHLDHRMWIESNKIGALFTGKASFYRLSCLYNENLRKLAVQNYEFRQSTYKKELEELTRWSKKRGFIDMGFGREKTLYSFFASASSFFLPRDSIIRSITTKSSIVITVADDFYDMEGSMTDLQVLTQAIQKWDGKDLKGHSKKIFDAVDEIVRFVAINHQDGSKLEPKLRDIWRETFCSWMTERKWSNGGFIPSKKEYLEVGMISIASHTIALLASCLSNSSLSKHTLKPGQYEEITKLLMASSRLLNDMQSYQKEEEDGKINFVLLHVKENPGINVVDAITFVKEIVNEKRKEFLEHAFLDDLNNTDNMPKSCKQIHLACMKVFHMFFNSTNLFDTETELLHDINKAIFLSIEDQTLVSPLLKAKPPPNMLKGKETLKISAYFKRSLKIKRLLSFMGLKTRFEGESGKLYTSPNLG